MAKSVLFHPAERVDLNDLQYGASNYVDGKQNDFMKMIHGMGVLDGFRVKILNQGQAPATIEIYNGKAVNWLGRLISDESGKNAERVVLTRASTEYWIEVEFAEIDADPDTRAFWDPLVDNATPYPDGQEIDLARTMTRRVPTWRVKTPINNNPIGNRSDAGYTPTRFSLANNNTIPIAVIRTDSSGNIIKGDPNTTSTGNDISVYSTVVGANQWFLKVSGYGETGTPALDSGGNEWVYGRKTSDQRRRFFEPLIPPFGFGVSDEIAGAETVHDGWVRDIKSMYDHLTGQIAQVKLGARTSDMGVYHSAKITNMADDLSYVIVKTILDNGSPVGNVSSQVDQFINATIQIVDTTSNWNGFYARISGNEKINGSGETKVFLDLPSDFPEWLEFPDFSSVTLSCYIIQYRQNSWLTKPCPSSGNRGLNELDAEVVAARTDWWSGKSFLKLGSRLNAEKFPILTVSPPTTIVDSDTGEPTSNTHPRADSFQGALTIQSEVNTVIASGKEGVIYFRSGNYNFDLVPDGTSVFEVKNVYGLTFEGVGPQETVIERIFNTGPMFEMESANDITFKNMTINGYGTTLSFVSCNRIRFINCIINASTLDTTTIAISFGAMVDFYLEDTDFYVMGNGITSTSMSGCTLSNCNFFDVGDPLKTEYVFKTGTIVNSHIYSCKFTGFVSKSVFVATNFSYSTFYQNSIFGNTSLAGTSVLSFGIVNHSRISNVIMEQYSADNKTQTAIICTDIQYSVIENINASNVGAGLVATSLLRSCLDNLIFVVNSGGNCIKINGNVTYSHIKDCDLASEGSVAAGLYLLGTIQQLVIENNQFQNVSSSGLPYGVYLTGSSVKMLAVVNNHFNNVDRAIQATSITSGENIYISGNKAKDGTNAAFSFKFVTSVTQFVFVHNECRNYDTYGLTVDASGCNMEHCHISNNILKATLRPLELWSSSGGSFSFGTIFNNTCVGATNGVIVLGANATGVAPALAGTPFNFYHSYVDYNKISVTVGITGAMWIAALYSTYLDKNIVYGGYSSFGIRVAGIVDCSYISMNNVDITVAGSGGIEFLTTVNDSEVCGNKVNMTSGNNIYFSSTVTKTNVNDNNTDTGSGNGIYVSGLFSYSEMNRNNVKVLGAASVGIKLATIGSHTNSVSGNIINGEAVSTYAIYMRGITKSVIVGNNSRTFDRGFYMEDATDCMVSGNFFANMANANFKFIYTNATGTNLMGGAHDPGMAADLNYSDLTGAGNRWLSTFNLGIP